VCSSDLAAWRLGGKMGLGATELVWMRFAVFFATAAVIFLLGVRKWLPRTDRYHHETPAAVPETSLDAAGSEP
jgi:hypothetical protein